MFVGPVSVSVFVSVSVISSVVDGACTCTGDVARDVDNGEEGNEEEVGEDCVMIFRRFKVSGIILAEVKLTLSKPVPSTKCAARCAVSWDSKIAKYLLAW